MQYYISVISALEQYFNCRNWKKLFLEGGCYWLAKILQNGIPLSHIMINRIEEHCALYFENGLYDVRGKLSTRNFTIARDRDISFMEKNYIPHFDCKKVEGYLRHQKLLD